MAINTLTDIANQALMRIGFSAVISDIDTPASPANKLKVLLEGVISSVQLEFWWRELLVEVSIPASATVRSDEKLEYYLPSNMLRLKEIAAPSDFFIIGNKIVTGQIAPLKIIYLKRSENVGEWSEYLKECVYTMLASKAAKELKNDAQLMQFFQAEYEQKILPRAKTAISKDTNVGKQSASYQGSWLNSFYASK